MTSEAQGKPLPRPPRRKAARRRETGARSLLAVAGAVVGLLVLARLAGPRLHPCRSFEEKVCADLGSERCQIFRERHLDQFTKPHRRFAAWRRLHIEAFVHGVLGWDLERTHGTCFDLLMTYDASKDVYQRLVPRAP